jgi:Protein of unknown function (DUF3800)
VLKAYLDASNEDTGNPVAVVAGFVGGERQWEAFDAAWKPFLLEFGLKRFHATEFWARKGPYNNWSEAKHRMAKKDVCRILNSLRLIGVGASVNIHAFNEWRVKASQFYHNDPYYFCLDYALRILIHVVSEYPKDDGIMIYVDQDKKREPVGKQIATWHQERLRRSPLSLIGPDRTRKVETYFKSSIDFAPLQAADILAHSTFQWSRDYLNGGKIDEPYFLSCMREKCAITTQFFFDVQMIEIAWQDKFQADAKH